ncbi:hypothetical protein MCUN1_003000 [Malassezia cuniculi]|uniref:Uncharacterized protein n=1 Tax=Malassezia cuniculi TaxID=948313 RepID=A0AAF0EVW9_9BASI|nr:hypothetical protein MCUN1_003000 [Malassezia cuniculi]
MVAVARTVELEQVCATLTSDSNALPDGARLAIGSFVEEYSNHIQVLGASKDENGTPDVTVLADALHPYPPTKLGFQPGSASDDRQYKSAQWGSDDLSNSFSNRSSMSSVSSSSTADLSDNGTDSFPDSELLASSADCLRIWSIDRNDDFSEFNHAYESMSLRQWPSKQREARTPFVLQEKSTLVHNKSSTSAPAPLTSFSWNAPSPNLIVTSSIDTTCTVWDLPTRTALTQLIAHDREVYDVDWCPGSSDIFASVGADGSVRVFDLRSLEHSTIIYETVGTQSTQGSQSSPLLRIAFNPWDANYLATFHLESQTVQILDIRAPGTPILELRGHSGAVNSIAWGAPSQGLGRNGPSKGMICTGGDDAQCLVYDLASATLRSASAQGRRSRNSARASPANEGLRIGAEVPVLAYTAPSMVNNVVWLRSPLSMRRAPQPKHNSFYRNLLQEWTDFSSASSTQGTGNSDWLALCAGRAVKMLRV